MWNDLPTLCLTPERQMVIVVQSTVGWFLELCFLLFFMAQVLVGLRKHFINIFVFLTWPCAASFKNNNKETEEGGKKSGMSMERSIIILSCLTSLDSSKPIQKRISVTTRASAHLLLRSRNNNSRKEDAYGKGSTLDPKLIPSQRTEQ